MNRTRPFRPIRRLTCALAVLATALLAAATAAPAAFAEPVPPVGGGGDVIVAPPPPPQIVDGGMPGWQIALIAVAAAILAAVVAVFLDRARAGRRHQAAPGT
jgi:ABC-type branched-subunit amino acid transport system permease subunit